MTPPALRLRRRMGALAAATSAWLPAVAPAADPSATAPPVAEHRVVSGDTLFDLARRYHGDAEAWPAIARANGIGDPRRLRPGTRLVIPARAPAGRPVLAVVHYLRGAVSATGAGCGAGCAPEPLTAGDTLGDGQVIEVPARGFVTLRLPDGSLLHLDAGTRLRIDELREPRAADRLRARFDLQRGRVESVVRPQPAGSRFDVRTPLAVAGVRGTRFGVSLDEAGTAMLSDVTEGRVEITPTSVAAPRVSAARAPAGTLVAAGQGAVLRAGAGQTVDVRPLLPAPDLSGLPSPLRGRPADLPIGPVEGAAGYEVQAASIDDPAAVQHSEVTPSPRISLGTLPPGRYLLRVRALDAQGLGGLPATRAVEVTPLPPAPLAQSPAQDAPVPQGLVELVCTNVPGADGYRLEWSRGVGLALDTADDGSCRFRLELREAGPVHWRVASTVRGPGGRLDVGRFSDTLRFTVVPPPAVPLAGEAAAPSADGTLAWAGAPGLRYEVQQASDAGFTRDTATQSVERPPVTLVPASPCVPTYVRLRALDRLGQASPWSATRVLNAPAAVCLGDDQALRDGAGQPVQRTRP